MATAQSVTPPMISADERQRRAKSIHSIRRSQMMEGGDISVFSQGVFEQYIQGEITLSDVGLKLKEHHQLP